ncbi:hypothetical protein AWB68_03630 [Caballeronia choica]|uniref:Uncharacterized protein n=1 Tax=Caballeronia choica TaxID=326476 RepID=A0A158JB46_9BURK|nr:hypothetical protein AWB68_03630 [Caballeronia choica]
MSGVATVPGRGRKPKPTARKIAAGNPGKRMLNKDEPDFGSVTNLDPPEWIKGYAAEMWMCDAAALRATGAPVDRFGSAGDVLLSVRRLAARLRGSG